MLVIRRLFGTGTNGIAPSGLPLLLCLFPGLAPWVQGPNCGSPERAAQGVRSQLQIYARHKAPLWYRDQRHRPFGASLVTVLVPRACALGFPESPLRG